MPGKKRETREEALARLKREAEGKILFKGKTPSRKKIPLHKGKSPKPTPLEIRRRRAAALRAKLTPPSGLDALNQALNPKKKKDK